MVEVAFIVWTDSGNSDSYSSSNRNSNSHMGSNRRRSSSSSKKLDQSSPRPKPSVALLTFYKGQLEELMKAIEKCRKGYVNSVSHHAGWGLVALAGGFQGIREHNPCRI